MRKAQEIAHLGSWTNDFETGISNWSEEQCRIFGLPEDDNQQSLDSFLSFIHPEDFDFVKDRIEESRTTLKDNSFFTRIVLKDGTIKFIYAESRFESNKEGKPIILYGITHDLTQQKETEEELIINNAELKKINSELDRFVYSVSHELRSPLTTVMGLYKIIDLENLQDENKEVLNLIIRSVIKMDETLKEILDYSRNARNIIKTEKINFRDIIDSAFENSSYHQADFRFDKRINIKENTPFYSDPARIKVIINNLISNTLKYGRRDNTSFIEVNIMVNDKELIMEISDNGIGIKEELQQDIFKMFYRATIVAFGSGLGLYIAKECLDKLGGTINVESEFGKGSKFIVAIPNILNSIT